MATSFSQTVSFTFALNSLTVIKSMQESEIYKFVDSELSKLNQSVESLQEGSFNQKLWIPIFRIVGYALLLLTLLDLADIFIPLGFMNPSWELKTIGVLVERVPIPLIGLMLVLAGGLDWRSKWEAGLLKLLSWLALLVGVLYLLLIPVGIMDTIRLNTLNNAVIDNSYNQKISQSDHVEQQLNKTSPEQLVNILKTQGRVINGKSPQEIKSQILSEFSQAKQQFKKKTEQDRFSQHFSLLKSSIKFNIGALIAGTFFISIWKASPWAR